MTATQEILFLGDSETGVGSRLTVAQTTLVQAQAACLVNPWHTNGRLGFLAKTSPISAAIKEASGAGPFRQLGRTGSLKLGECTSTGGGQLVGTNYMIHAAVTSRFGQSSLAVVEDAVGNIILTARRLGVRTLAMPLLAADVAHLDSSAVAQVIRDEFARSGAELQQLILALPDPASYDQVCRHLLEGGRKAMPRRKPENRIANERSVEEEISMDPALA